MMNELVYKTKTAILTFFAASILLLFSSNINAAEIDGRLSSELYLYETNDASHTLIYERLRANLNLYQNANNQSVGIHTYLRWNSDLSNKAHDNPRTYIYDTYFKLKNYPHNSEIRIGRQFAFNPVGSVLLDGLKIKYQIARKTSAEIYGGSEVSSTNPDKIQKLSDFGAYGGRISSRLGSARLGLSGLLRQFKGDVSSFRVGLDGRYSVKKLNLYSRLSYNVYNLRLAEILMRSSYSMTDYYFSAEFRWREPSVNASSLFTLIDFNRYREFRLEGHRKIWSQMRLISSFNLNLYDDDNSIGFKIGLASNRWSLAWQSKSGYGGKNSGLVGFGSVKLYQTWELYASASLNRYKVQEMQEKLNDAYATSIGIRKNLGKGFSFQTEGQYMRNAVQTDDTRLFVRVTKRFTSK